jgi:hypothetical protein
VRSGRHGDNSRDVHRCSQTRAAQAGGTWGGSGDSAGLRRGPMGSQASGGLPRLVPFQDPGSPAGAVRLLRVLLLRFLG